jgi:hypothetical protein
MTSRSQVEETGLKTGALVLMDLVLLTEEEREDEAWLLRKRSLSRKSASEIGLAISAATAGDGRALVLGESSSHFPCPLS